MTMQKLQWRYQEATTGQPFELKWRALSTYVLFDTMFRYSTLTLRLWTADEESLSQESIFMNTISNGTNRDSNNCGAVV